MPKPGQGGPQEGLNRKSIGKQTVCVGAEAWPRWASRGPQPQNYWKTNGFCDCWNHLEARPTRDLIINLCARKDLADARWRPSGGWGALGGPWGFGGWGPTQGVSIRMALAKHGASV